MREKNKIQLGLVVIFILVLIFVIFNILGKSGKVKKEQANIKSGSKVQAGAPNAPVSTGKSLFDSLDAQAEGVTLVRDPFSSVPLVAEKTSGRGVVLSGIVWGKDKPTAIINNSIVRVGDTVSGNVVVRIQRDRVVLNDGNNDFELKLGH